MSDAAGLPPGIAEIFQQGHGPLSEMERGAAAAFLSQHLETVREHLQRNPVLDLALARRVAASLRDLLGVYETLPGDHQNLVGGAVRYFLERRDVDDDLASATGFDDDALVVNSVARAIGRPELGCWA